MKKRIKVSSGDRDGVHPYLTPQFWINSSNWFWCNSRYSTKTQEDMYQRLVIPAMEEIAKKNKTDLIAKISR